jgi:hypothetical protein
LFKLFIYIIPSFSFVITHKKNQSFQIDLIIDVALVRRFYLLEQVRGIEPPYSAWEADVLPLNYTCLRATLNILSLFLQ